MIANCNYVAIQLTSMQHYNKKKPPPGRYTGPLENLLFWTAMLILLPAFPLLLDWITKTRIWTYECTKGMCLNREKSIVEVYKPLIPPDWTELQAKLWLLINVICLGIGIIIKVSLLLFWHNLHVKSSALSRWTSVSAMTTAAKLLLAVVIEQLGIPADMPMGQPPQGPIGTRLLEVSRWPRESQVG